MNKTIWIILITVSITLNSCSSQNNTPINIEHAECLYEYSMRQYSQKDIISSKNCEENWNWEINDGWNISKEKGFAYKIEYNKNNLYVINTFYSSTGSGDFTHLFLIEIKNDTFELIESIAGGDRC